MKILYVIPSYEPAWAFGGTVTATSQLCRGLVRQGGDVTVYTTDADGKGGHLDVPLNKPVELGGVKVFYSHCDFGAKKAFYSRELAHLLGETVGEFDLVHVSAIWQWIQLDVYEACVRLSIPYVVTPNGSFKHYPWKQGALKKRLFWYVIGKKSVKNAAAIHFTTEAEREDSLSNLRLLQNMANFVVPNGIQIERKSKKENIRKILKIDPEKFVILFMGRIEKIKGIDFVIKAIRKVNNYKINLLIVGPEEDKHYCDYLRSLITQLRLDDTVFWQGPIDRTEIWDYYEGSDILVQMSYSENFALTVIEAMSCGVPVLINSNIGIWKEIRADNSGFIVEQNAEAIAGIIKELIDNKQMLQEVSANARKSVEKRYDIQKVAPLMLKAYEDILTGRKSAELQWR